MPQDQGVVNTRASTAEIRSTATDSGHHERCVHSPVLGKPGGCPVGVFAPQQGTHHRVPEAFKGQPEEIKAGGAGVDDQGAALAANVGQPGGGQLGDDSAAVPRLESGLLHERDHGIGHLLEPRIVILEAETGPVVVFDDHPPAGAQGGHQAVEDSLALGQVLEHQSGMHQVELALRQLVGPDV